MVRPIEVGRRIKGVGTVIEVRGCCWLARRLGPSVFEYVMGEVVMYHGSSTEMILADRKKPSIEDVLSEFRQKADAITARRAAEFDPDRIVKIWD